MRHDSSGITLIELILALSIAAFVVILVIGSMESHQTQVHEALRQEAGLESDKVVVAAANLLLARSLEQADRVNILSANPGHIELRLFEPGVDQPPQCPVGSCTTVGAVPSPCCYDIAANYRWEQYRYDPTLNMLQWFPNSRDPVTGNAQCTDVVDLGHHITSLSFQYQDTTAPAPPGGDPSVVTFAASPADLDMIAFSLMWDDEQGRSLEYHQSVASRGISYSDVGAGAAGPFDSGWGVDPSNISPPPPACP